MPRRLASRVQETTTTTGTGPVTLIGAVDGFRTFDSVCTAGDRVSYVIEAVDANGIPTGDWESGEGTYNGSNVLDRTTVQESSNAGAAVSFAAGSKRVSMQLHGSGNNALDIGGEALFASGYGITFRDAAGTSSVAGVYNDGAGAAEINVTTAFRVATWGGATDLLTVDPVNDLSTFGTPIVAPNVIGLNTGDQDLSGLATVEALGAGLAGRENAITPGTVGQYWRGDKTWQDLPDERLLATVASTTNFGGSAPLEATADTTEITADSTTPIEGAPSGPRSLFMEINEDLAEEYARRGI